MKKALLILAVLGASLAAVSTARAGDAPMSRLDAYASAIAGHRAHVWCEDNWGDWDDVAYRAGIVGHYLDGFTDLAEPVVYINPSHCESLHVALETGPWGYLDAGLAPYAGAIAALAHEAVHQRGIDDEAVTECTSMPLAVPTAVAHLGLPATYTTTKIVKVRKKVNGRWAMVSAAKRVVVKNPDVARIGRWIRAIHSSRPDEYLGGC